MLNGPKNHKNKVQSKTHYETPGSKYHKGTQNEEDQEHRLITVGGINYRDRGGVKALLLSTNLHPGPRCKINFVCYTFSRFVYVWF